MSAAVVCRIYGDSLRHRRRGLGHGDYMTVGPTLNDIITRRYRAMRKTGMGAYEARSTIVTLLLAGYSAEWHPRRAA